MKELLAAMSGFWILGILALSLQGISYLLQLVASSYPLFFKFSKYYYFLYIYVYIFFHYWANLATAN